MIPDHLGLLTAFVAVAEERSFTKAAVRLGVSTSALSHAIRGLEERLGVRLLARTTRSVAPTEAGDQLLAQVGPALGDVRTALDGVGIAFTFEEEVAPLLARKRLVRVLEDWCPPFPGFFVYYPNRRHQPPGLTALVETLRNRA